MVNAGDVIRASDVSVQACRITRTVGINVADGTAQTINFNSELFDTDSMHDNSVNNSRITINTAGFYIVGFQGRLESRSTYRVLQAQILLNGSTTIAIGQFVGSSPSVPQRIFISTVYQFQASDYLEVLVYQDNTGDAASSLEVVNGQSPEFYAARLGS